MGLLGGIIEFQARCYLYSKETVILVISLELLSAIQASLGVG
jgi:hypothetical protein